MNPIVVLVGQPNTGKTTLFNQLTGARFKTVNYPGSTVVYAVGKTILGGQRAIVVDTPGIISLVPRTEDERVSLAVMLSTQDYVKQGGSTPDVVVGVVDMSQPVRHLVLIKQVIEAGFNVVVALTMPDMAKKKGLQLDAAVLSTHLNCPVNVVNSRTGEGIDALKKDILEISSHASGPIHVSSEIDNDWLSDQFSWAEDLVETCAVRCPRERGFDLDRVALHPVLGPFFFFVMMSVFFWSIFALASPLMEMINQSVGAISEFLARNLPQTIWSQILSEGVVPGVGAVLVFLPQIVILFFALALLEGSGYLARGAMIIDKPLSYFGLNGKSFVPLLSGFACAIPAMMAARTVPGKKERLITLIMIPLMTCSARLPVYGLLLSMLFISSPVWAGIGLALVYMGGIVLSLVVASVLQKWMPKMELGGFHMELPDWRIPVMKSVILQTIDHSLSFIKRAGPTIIMVSVVLWGSSQFPTAEHSILKIVGHALEPLLHPLGVDWRVGVALLFAFAAREVFVSGLAVVFFQDHAHSTLLDTLKHATFDNSHQLIFTPATSIGLIIFFMVSMQCMATLAVAKKETGGWAWPLGMLGAYVALAYGLAVAVVQGLRYCGMP